MVYKWKRWCQFLCQVWHYLEEGLKEGLRMHFKYFPLKALQPKSLINHELEDKIIIISILFFWINKNLILSRKLNKIKIFKHQIHTMLYWYMHWCILLSLWHVMKRTHQMRQRVKFYGAGNNKIWISGLSTLINKLLNINCRLL